MKKFLPLAAMLMFLPMSVHAGKTESKNEVVVEIQTAKGAKPVTLVRKGDGFVGPRGEYYPEFPSKRTLEAVYGSSSSKSATPKPAAASGAMKEGITVKQVAGGVNIFRNGKKWTEIRTKYPDIRGWKLIRENTCIVVKSGVGREPGFVEMFDVKSGQRLEKIKATEIKGGKPAWAKNFAE